MMSGKRLQDHRDGKVSCLGEYLIHQTDSLDDPALFGYDGFTRTKSS